MLRKRPKLSVVVVFFNMRREAVRTLHSLTLGYQQNIQLDDYEVIVVDSGSSQPLDPSWVESLQDNFRYAFIQPSAPTPCEAMNHGIRMAKGDWVACAIDGARILSPGILQYSLAALQLRANAFVYTLGLHLGPDKQNISIEQGYCQSVEDRLLGDSQWEEDGYRLSPISALAGSAPKGYLGPIAESNFFSVSRQTLLDCGGFDQSFQSSGGGLVNLDIFKSLLESPSLEPIMLLGEASFHQFHGGVSTNVPAHKHPIADFHAEYQRIRGRAYEKPVQQPLYFGRIHPLSQRFLNPPSKPV